MSSFGKPAISCMCCNRALRTRMRWRCTSHTDLPSWMRAARILVHRLLLAPALPLCHVACSLPTAAWPQYLPECLVVSGVFVA